jgi:hypothetical protein
VSFGDALRRAGIGPRHTRPGTQRLACPQCAQAKHRPRDDALALLIEDSGATWLCHRCGFRGGVRDGKAPTFRTGPPKPTPERTPVSPDRALTIWRAAGPAPAHHPYLVRKHLPPDGLRLVERFAFSARGILPCALLVPMRDASGSIVNLQGIAGDGTKRFLAGAPTRGAFACFGAWRREVVPELLAIGEGFASVASYVRMHPAYRGVAAMSAGQLAAVARLIRGKFPDAEIVIVADQDEAGARAAGEAAVLARAEVHIPGFRHVRVKDWNDLEALRASE